MHALMNVRFISLLSATQVWQCIRHSPSCLAGFPCSPFAWGLYEEQKYKRLVGRHEPGRHRHQTYSIRVPTKVLGTESQLFNKLVIPFTFGNTHSDLNNNAPALGISQISIVARESVFEEHIRH